MKVRQILLVAIIVVLSLCSRVNAAGRTLSDRLEPTNWVSAEASASQERALKLFKGALHVHTFYSDGKDTVAGRVASARKVGLDFVVLTDHIWNEKAPDECKQNTVEGKFLCTMGLESSTKIAHVPAGFVYTKPPIPNGDWSNYFGAVKTQGGFCWVAHPQWQKETYGEYPFDNWNTTSYNLSMIDGVEVWNEASSQCRPDPTTTFAGGVWDSLLAKGYRVWGLAAEDRHAQGGLGFAVVTAYTYELKLSSIAEALRLGRFNSIRTPYSGQYQFFKFDVRSSELGLPGSVVNVREGQEVSIHVEYNITWLNRAPLSRVDNVQIIRDGQIMYSHNPYASSINLTINDRPQKWSVYRALIKDNAGGWGFSNPIFVNPVPASYFEARNTLEKANSLRSSALVSNFQSQEAQSLIQQALEAHYLAEGAFSKGDFAAALTYAQKAITLFEKASSVEQAYRKLPRTQDQMPAYVVTSVVLVVVAAGAYVIRKKTKVKEIISSQLKAQLK